MKTLFVNAKVVTPYRMLPAGTSVLVEDGRIADVSVSAVEPASFNGRIIDAKGAYLAPGFIDTHTHGAGDHDFLDGSVDDVTAACRAHLEFGTTSIVPTTLSGRYDELLAGLTNVTRAQQITEGMPHILGAHLEGPYFAPAQNGAQDEKYLKLPDPAEYREILDRFPIVRKWTVAPELPGAGEMGRYLASRGVIASIGHTAGTEEDVANAIENGYTMVTHLYNGMSRLTRKNAKMYLGVAESALLHDELTAEIIADGCHLPVPLLKLIVKAKGIDRICLVTDSMRAAGTNASESILGSRAHGQRVEIEGGVAYMPGRASFGGSVCTADRLIRTMHSLVGLPLTSALQMLTVNPAKSMGVFGRTGSVSIGKNADLILFDEQINIKLVMVMGNVWKDQTAGSQL